jgi:hypothetical protein
MIIVSLILILVTVISSVMGRDRKVGVIDGGCCGMSCRMRGWMEIKEAGAECAVERRER